MAPVAPCPCCGEPTVGVLIVGRIFDHCCDRCSDEIDANFDRLVDRFLADGSLDLNGG